MILSALAASNPEFPHRTLLAMAKAIGPVDWSEVRLLDQNSPGFRRHYKYQMYCNGLFRSALHTQELGRVRLVPIRRAHPRDILVAPWNIPAIMRSIVQRKVFRPIILNRSYQVVDGHHRLTACKALGLTEIPAFVMVKQGSRLRLKEVRDL
jgi:hypothetical protein